MSEKMISCPECTGSGQAEGRVYHVCCKLCDGTGKVPKSVYLVGKRKPTEKEIAYGKELESFPYIRDDLGELWFFNGRRVNLVSLWNVNGSGYYCSSWEDAIDTLKKDGYITKKCKKCELLSELYGGTKKSEREYFVMTELFVMLHGQDVCDDANDETANK